MRSPVSDDLIDYEQLAQAFSQALIAKLRKHNVGDSFLDYWVPDADPVLGIAGMIDSARLSGRAEISVRFKKATVPDSRLSALTTAVGRFAAVTLRNEGEGRVLCATDMSKDRSRLADKPAGQKPKYWDAKNLTGAATAFGIATDRWDSREFPDLADVHPYFRKALSTTLKSLTYEGGLKDDQRNLLRLQAQEGTISLTLDIDSVTHIVETARYTGAEKPSERAALDLFCRAAEHLPIQEVADHVGPKIINQLIDEDLPAPVTGVLLPVNVGAAFMKGPLLARQIYDRYRAMHAIRRETNFYYAPPAVAWMASSNDERNQSVMRGLRGFLQSEDLFQDDLELLRLEKNKYGFEVRCVFSFSDRIKIQDKPLLLRLLEKRLRRDVEPQLEVVADRARDSSPLRRLSNA